MDDTSKSLKYVASDDGMREELVLVLTHALDYSWAPMIEVDDREVTIVWVP